jgi:hypothetical protein
MTTRIKPRRPGPLAPKTVAVPSVTPTPASQAADAVAGKAGWTPGGRVPVKAPRAPALAAAGEKLLEKGQQALQRGRKVAQKVQDGSLQRAIGGPLARLSKAERRFLAANLPLALPFRDAADTTDAIVRHYAQTRFSAAGEKDASIYSDGAGNALRHATWNALMVKRAFDSGGRNLSVAAQKAQGFADAHEDNPNGSVAKWRSRCLGRTPPPATRSSSAPSSGHSKRAVCAKCPATRSSSRGEGRSQRSSLWPVSHSGRRSAARDTRRHRRNEGVGVLHRQLHEPAAHRPAQQPGESRSLQLEPHHVARRPEERHLVDEVGAPPDAGAIPGHLSLPDGHALQVAEREPLMEVTEGDVDPLCVDLPSSRRPPRQLEIDAAGRRLT